MHLQTKIQCVIGILTAVVIGIGAVCVSSASERCSLPMSETLSCTQGMAADDDISFPDSTTAPEETTTDEAPTQEDRSENAAENERRSRIIEDRRGRCGETCVTSETVPPTTEKPGPVYGEMTFKLYRAERLSSLSANGEGFPKARVIDCRAALDAILQVNTLDRNLPDDLQRISSLCTEEWFAEHRLVLVEVWENTISVEHSITRVVRTSNGVIVEGDRGIPQAFDGQAVTVHPLIAQPVFFIAVPDKTLTAEDTVSLRWAVCGKKPVQTTCGETTGMEGDCSVPNYFAAAAKDSRVCSSRNRKTARNEQYRYL